jgi:hypothetical protein
VKLAAAALIAVLAGTASAEPQDPKLDLTAFFAGRSHADNVLKIVFQSPTKLIVDSVGGKGDRGDFVLIDTVHEGDKPVRTRKWVMQPAGPNHFTGSLSDAVGPVDIVVSQPCRRAQVRPQVRPRRRHHPKAGLTRPRCYPFARGEKTWRP